MDRLRILAAAAALREFSVPQLVAYTGASEPDVGQVLRDEGELFRTEASRERDPQGRQSIRWALADSPGILTKLGELEARGESPHRSPPPADADVDRAAAVLSAEAALLRAWSPEEEAAAVTLARTALLAVAGIARGESGDPFSRRARAVQTFAELTEIACTSGGIGLNGLISAANALVELADLAQDRVTGFLRGLTEIAAASGALPPLGFVTRRRPEEAVAGLPADIEWIQRPGADTDFVFWIQRWCEPLLEQGLVAGVVIDEAEPDDVKDMVPPRVPVVVLSASDDAKRVNQVTRQGARFLSSRSDIGIDIATISKTLSSALEQTPDGSDHSADRQLADAFTRARFSVHLESGRRGEGGAMIAPRESSLLKALVDAADGLTREQLSAKLGLTQTEIAELLDGDLSAVLDEAEPPQSRFVQSARRAHTLRADAGILLALDIGPRHVRAARSDLRAELPPQDIALTRGDMKEEYDVPDRWVHADMDKALALARDQCIELLDDHSPDEIVGIGLAIAQPIDAVTGIRHPGMDPPTDWDGRVPVDELRALLGWTCPILPINDANAGLLAEARFGVAKGRRNVWHVRWTRGIGAGGLVDGRLYTGANGIAGEIGHLPVILTKEYRKKPPPKCPTCGHHCLQSVASIEALSEAIRKARGQAPGTPVELTAPETQDEEQVFKDAAFYVGQALAQMTTVVNPELITIGGEMRENYWEHIKGGLNRGLRQHAFPLAFDDVEIVAGERTGRAVLEGSLIHVLQQEAVHYLLARAKGVEPRRS